MQTKFALVKEEQLAISKIIVADVDVAPHGVLFPGYIMIQPEDATRGRQNYPGGTAMCVN